MINNLKIPMPRMKPFSTMFEMLKDAEKYKIENESEVSKKLLKELCNYIEQYISE